MAYSIVYVPLLWNAIAWGLLIGSVLVFKYPAIYLGVSVGGLVPVLLTFAGLRESAGWSAMMVVAVAVESLRSKDKSRHWLTPSLLAQYAFALLVIISLSWSPISGGYAGEKVRLFFGWAFIPFVGAVACALSGHFKHFLYSFFFIYVIIALSAFLQIGDALQDVAGLFDNRATSLIYDPIMLGRIAGLALLFLIWVSFQTSKSLRRIAAIILALPLSLLLAMTQTRGAILALGAGLAVLLLSTRMDRKMLVGLIALVAILAWCSWTIPFENLDRFTFLSSPELLLYQSSTTERLDLYKQALDVFLAFPVLGVGIGGASAYMTFLYPHNILLEIASELGMVGLALFMSLLLSVLVCSIRSLRGSFREPLVEICLASFAFAFVASLLSYDIQRNYLVWVFGGIVLAISSLKHQSTADDSMSTTIENMK